MRRGTTPRHTFTLPIDTSLLKEIVITYAQDEKPIVEKRKDDCKTEGKKIEVTLSQEDTLKFDKKKAYVQIQIRALTHDGVALASGIKNECLSDVLNEEVLE